MDRSIPPVLQASRLMVSKAPSFNERGSIVLVLLWGQWPVCSSMVCRALCYAPFEPWECCQLLCYNEHVRHGCNIYHSTSLKGVCTCYVYPVVNLASIDCWHIYACMLCVSCAGPFWDHVGSFEFSHYPGLLLVLLFFRLILLDTSGCERGFSAMNIIKNKMASMIGDGVLSDVMTIANFLTRYHYQWWRSGLGANRYHLA